MARISTMLQELVRTYRMIKGTEYLFTPPREVVGKCPRCGSDVAELQKGFFCQNEGCKFAIWKNNKWWAAKKKLWYWHLPVETKHYRRRKAKTMEEIEAKYGKQAI